MSRRPVPLWRELADWSRRKVRGGPVPHPLCFVCWHEVLTEEARWFRFLWSHCAAHPEHFEYCDERSWLQVGKRRTFEMWRQAWEVRVIVTSRNDD